MKKKLLIVTSVALVTFVVAALAQEVLSQNAVGYIKKTVPAAGGMTVISHPLESLETANLIFTNTSVAAEMPRGSIVYFWGGLSWEPGTKSTKTGVWGGSAVGKTVEPGEAFFLKTPATQLVDVVVTIAGEVPDSPTLQRLITGLSNLTIAGNPYPVDVVFTNTSLASNLARGAVAYFWTGTAWDPATKSTKTGAWGGAAVGKTVTAGEGFFVRNPSNNLTWVVDKPYSWP